MSLPGPVGHLQWHVGVDPEPSESPETVSVARAWMRRWPAADQDRTRAVPGCPAMLLAVMIYVDADLVVRHSECDVGRGLEVAGGFAAPHLIILSVGVLAVPAGAAAGRAPFFFGGSGMMPVQPAAW